MGFDDFFEHENKHHRHSDNYHDDQYRPSHSYKYRNDIKYQILSRMQSNPKLRSLFIIAAIALIIVVVIIAILLFPVIMKVIHYIGQNGIQGIIETIWKGTK
jgi:type IV secretory pathway component VirB8